MYPYLLFVHSLLRWAVVISLLYAIGIGLRGWFGRHPFLRHHNSARHVTATIAHVQLVVGYLLYFRSPLIAYFRSHHSQAIQQPQYAFFGQVHILVMTVAVIVITIGSSLAKRKGSDTGKHKTMALLFLLGLIIIAIAIPWPFSPFASRPYFRPL